MRYDRQARGPGEPGRAEAANPRSAEASFRIVRPPCPGRALPPAWRESVRGATALARAGFRASASGFYQDPPPALLAHPPAQFAQRPKRGLHAPEREA